MWKHRYDSTLILFCSHHQLGPWPWNNASLYRSTRVPFIKYLFHWTSVSWAHNYLATGQTGVTKTYCLPLYTGNPNSVIFSPLFKYTHHMAKPISLGLFQLANYFQFLAGNGVWLQFFFFKLLSNRNHTKLEQTWKLIGDQDELIKNGIRCGSCVDGTKPCSHIGSLSLKLMTPAIYFLGFFLSINVW